MDVDPYPCRARELLRQGPCRVAAEGAPLTPPAAGPVTLGTIFVFSHDGDGITATVGVGMSNMIDDGTLVQATILPARPSPSPP